MSARKYVTGGDIERLSTSELARKYGVAERTAREWKHRARLSADKPDFAAVSAGSEWEAGVQLEGDRGWLCSGPTDKPVTDWTKVMQIWNLDPEEFEVVGDVTFKAWDMGAKEKKQTGTDSKGKAIYEENLVKQRMYSYKARIKRRTDAEPRVDWTAWRKELKKTKAHRAVAEIGDKVYVILVADPQIGKKGTADALQNWKNGVQYHAHRLASLTERVPVVLAFMGDEHEGVVGHYANQPFTVEMNLHDQMLTDFDMRAWTIRELAPYGLTDVISVISNHGEQSRDARKGGEQITGRSDNSSTMISRMVQRLFEGWELNWHIAEGNPTVYLDIAGAKLAFSHGHVARGTGKGEMRVRTAIERQVMGDPAGAGAVDVFFTAHYHHFHAVEDRGRTIFGCPALEAEKSSEYMLDQYGIWSRPGMLGVLVGSAFGDRKWSSPEVSF